MIYSVYIYINTIYSIYINTMYSIYIYIYIYTRNLAMLGRALHKGAPGRVFGRPWRPNGRATAVGDPPLAHIWSF